MSKELTDIQKKILEHIITKRNGTGLIPTLAEIAAEFGYKNRATVQQHLQALEKKGFIKKSPKLSRGIELTPQNKFFIQQPILGEVAAGNPLVIYPDTIDSISLPSIAKMPKDSFLLRVKGNSLKDAFIFSGDIVIINPNIEPRKGNFVAAILDDAAVVKKFYRENGNIELHSENIEFEPIIIEQNYPRFKMVGVVIGVYRNMQ